MDVMVSELAIESFFPADDHTRQAVTRSARARAAATAAKSGDGHVLDEGEPHHGSYRPLMSEQRAERIHQWHEGAYRRARAITSGDQTFSCLGWTLVVTPQVMPITPVSDLLGEAVLAEVKGGDRVLDMGTGSGVNAVLAASKAARVLARG